MQMKSAKSEAWWSRFQALLDQQTDWPSEYLFKFIVPSEGLGDLKEVFGETPVQVRASSKGNYMSVTARMEMASSDEVIAIYHAAGKVEGVISL
jgi:hypothetical protein